MSFRVLLVATYELGRQPFALASAAAWLRADGFDVTCVDLSVEPFEETAVAGADLVALHLPMHTATRLSVDLLPALRTASPSAHVCCFGLYGPLNEDHLRGLGVQSVLGGEFEAQLWGLARRLRGDAPPGAQEPLTFRVPDRSGLPGLELYARLQAADGSLRDVGSTEATRGCRHLCRHCPVVPVYSGRFRAVPRDIVLEDVRRQVESGAEHVTFGDPDFFNAAVHGISIVERLHRDFPALTYDVTIKIEHLLRHRDLLPALKETGCLFVTSAVESLDDRVLGLLEKGHTRADFLEVVGLFRDAEIALHPTFLPFTPWATRGDYRDLLETMLDLDLVEHVAPIQYGIRLLITARSRLLEVPEIRRFAGAFDPGSLVHPWVHPDPEMDRLCDDVLEMVHRGEASGDGRGAIFARIWERAARTVDRTGAMLRRLRDGEPLLPRAAVPFLTEPWYC